LVSKSRGVAVSAAKKRSTFRRLIPLSQGAPYDV
jgi:hypothetical protein